jgi:hypothetical protein
MKYIIIGICTVYIIDSGVGVFGLLVVDVRNMEGSHITPHPSGRLMFAR